MTQDWTLHEEDLDQSPGQAVSDQPEPKDDAAGPVARKASGRVRQRPSRSLTRRPGNRQGQPYAQNRRTHFAAVDQWVNGWLLPMWTRDLHADSLTWCPQWWRHPEAVARLTGLWLSWEHLRLDAGTGMSSWWRDHADHHLPVLLSSSGVFKGCSPSGHTEYPTPQLPSDPSPEGLFDT